MTERQANSAPGMVNTLALMLILGIGAVPAGASDHAELVRELRNCAHIEARDDRLACLDRLSNEVLREDDIVGQADKIAAAEKKPSAKSANDSESGKKAIAGVLMSCEKNAEGKYLFYLENGQIWKQVSQQKERYHDCDWSITIHRDLFGYHMKRSDDDRSIRVRRLR